MSMYYTQYYPQTIYHSASNSQYQPASGASPYQNTLINSLYSQYNPSNPHQNYFCYIPSEYPTEYTVATPFYPDYYYWKNPQSLPNEAYEADTKALEQSFSNLDLSPYLDASRNNILEYDSMQHTNKPMLSNSKFDFKKANDATKPTSSRYWRNTRSGGSPKMQVPSQYNPKDFKHNLDNARFFVIKSYAEEDIFRSIKHEVWCSTEFGNKRLDTAYRSKPDNSCIYLFFSANGTGHFCGVAMMTSSVDFNNSSDLWLQRKWKGQFSVKWLYVKDVPNNQFRYILLENNENKPVTNSRDTQEVLGHKGVDVFQIIHNYKHHSSIFDDYPLEH